MTGWLQHRLLAQRQSDNRQAASADCPTDVDTVISPNPIRCEICNPAGGRYCQVVEIQSDPDSWIGYPSIPIFKCCWCNWHY